MSDFLYLICPNPNCKGTIEVTVYRGPNAGQRFTPENAPLSIIEEVNQMSCDGQVQCTICGLHVYLAVQFITEVVPLGEGKRRWRE